MPPAAEATLPIAIVRVAEPVLLVFAAAGNANHGRNRDNAETGAIMQLRSNAVQKSRLICGRPHGAVNFNGASRARGSLCEFRLLDRQMYFARVFASSSLRPFGGIGMGPHTPVSLFDLLPR